MTYVRYMRADQEIHDDRYPWQFGSLGRFCLDHNLPMDAQSAGILYVEVVRLQDIEAKLRKAIETGATADWLAVHKALGIS